MGTMKIIGITGPARSGKDTLASALLDETVTGERMSFASPIRGFVAGLLGVTVGELEDGPIKEAPQAEFGGKSPRQMMQTLGTEWGRTLVDEDLWINVARRKLLRYTAMHRSLRPELVVFSDVRFENEAAMLRNLGGVIVHVHRPGAATVHAHVSEAGVAFDSKDIKVHNMHGLNHLQKLARELLLRR